jgi:hypothetical protein
MPFDRTYSPDRFAYFGFVNCPNPLHTDVQIFLCKEFQTSVSAVQKTIFFRYKDQLISSVVSASYGYYMKRTNKCVGKM